MVKNIEVKMSIKTNKINYNKFAFLKNTNIFEQINQRIKSGQKGATVIVPHVCNNVNAFGAGFAGEVSTIYPTVKANFHMLGSKSKLGHTQFVSVAKEEKYKHSIIFANMIAQNKLLSHDNKRPLNYGALVYCMNQVRTHIKDLESNTEMSRIEIHAPKFGSGLAGGHWNFIADLIDDIWYDIPVFIYTL